MSTFGWVMAGLGIFAALVILGAIAFLIWADDTSEDWH